MMREFIKMSKLSKKSLLLGVILFIVLGEIVKRCKSKMYGSDLINLDTLIKERVPLARHMGAKLVALSDDSVCMHAPLAANLNHHQTAFAGSLYSVCVLTGYSLLHLKLLQLDLDTQIVIQQAQINYHRPVTTDLETQCELPDLKCYERFLAMLKRRGVARIELTVNIFQQGILAVSLAGSYVARLVANNNFKTPN